LRKQNKKKRWNSGKIGKTRITIFKIRTRDRWVLMVDPSEGGEKRYGVGVRRVCVTVQLVNDWGEKKG